MRKMKNLRECIGYVILPIGLDIDREKRNLKLNLLIHSCVHILFMLMQLLMNENQKLSQYKKMISVRWKKKKNVQKIFSLRFSRTLSRTWLIKTSESKFENLDSIRRENISIYSIFKTFKYRDAIGSKSDMVKFELPKFPHHCFFCQISKVYGNIWFRRSGYCSWICGCRCTRR